VNNNIPDSTLEEIQKCLFERSKIQAIKLYKEATGEGLKESKEAIERLDSELSSKFPERYKVGPKAAGCMSVLALIAVPVALVVGYAVLEFI
jgi:preprotein translocase subunit SecF